MTRLKSIVSGVLLLATTSIFAQDSDMEDRKLRFGLHASPNFGWITPKIPEFETNKLNPRVGFGYGLMFDYKFSESANYLFNTGFNITSFGGGLTEPAMRTETVNGNEVQIPSKLTRTYKLNYVNVPLLLKMRTNEIGYMSYFASIGADVGVRARAFGSDTYESMDGAKITIAQDADIKDQINLFRAALNISGGAEYNLTGNTNIMLGLGWHNTFINMYRLKADRVLTPDDNGFPLLDDNGDAIESQRKNAINNYISLDIGIFF